MVQGAIESRCATLCDGQRREAKLGNPDYFFRSAILFRTSASRSSLRSGMAASPRIQASSSVAGTRSRTARSSSPSRSAACRSSRRFVLSATVPESYGVPTPTTMRGSTYAALLAQGSASRSRSIEPPRGLLTPLLPVRDRLGVGCAARESGRRRWHIKSAANGRRDADDAAWQLWERKRHEGFPAIISQTNDFRLVQRARFRCRAG